jgi:cobalt-zinc-cadmium efflux system protein
MRPLLIALGITTTFLVVEFVGGLLTGSLALLADAGHMVLDAGALVLALLAQRISQRPPSHTRSYGYSRVEVMAALANGVTLWILAAWILWEAYQRVQAPPEVKSLPMLIVAAFGLLANVASATVLMRSARHSLNLRAAFLHVVGDGLGSVGAIVAGALMLTQGWYVADPAISAFIGLLMLVTSSRVVWDAVHVLLEGTPRNVDLRKVEALLCQPPAVQSVHDLHVWSITSGYNVLSAHVVTCGPLDAADREALLIHLHQTVEARFPIQHTTIQVEETTTQCAEAHAPSIEAHDQLN